MPCWFYNKKDLRFTPSLKNGIDPTVEMKYRREGVKFIIEASNKLGLRHDACATGVVYFHRFYMFHAFIEFPRHVVAASCLFLAGKVEETPKKCKDVVKVCRGLLNDEQFSVFTDNPKEEIMTYERILLQTLKFDLQVDHPYVHLVRMAKQIQGDKAQLAKVVQMAWTFVNDSRYSTLCLQWEPEIIAVSMLYLATRLSKFEITDWAGKQHGNKLKWWEALIEGLTQELIEDVCHQVLDFYSSSQKEQTSPTIATPGPQQPTSHSGSPEETKTPKMGATAETMTTDYVMTKPIPSVGGQSAISTIPSGTVKIGYDGQMSTSKHTGSHFSTHNPYVSSQMYGSSYMSNEGSQSIQSLIRQENRGELYNKPASNYSDYPPQNQNLVYPPVSSATQYPYDYNSYPSSLHNSGSYTQDSIGNPYTPALITHTYTQPTATGGQYYHSHSQPTTPVLQGASSTGLATVRITGRQQRR